MLGCAVKGALKRALSACVPKERDSRLLAVALGLREMAIVFVALVCYL